MKIKSIKKHLKPYGIVANRRTTINHAFAAAVAHHDEFDETAITHQIAALGLIAANGTLLCAYCLAVAETWDHVRATVKNSEFSGHGHVVANLLPCCKPCNSRKGNRDWLFFFNEQILSDEAVARRNKIAGHLKSSKISLEFLQSSTRYRELMSLKSQVLDLLGYADRLAGEIRDELGGAQPPVPGANPLPRKRRP